MTFNKTAPISEFMSTHIHSIREDAGAEKAWEMMDKYKVRHLPVLAGGELKGLLSRSDLHAAMKGGKAKIEEISVEQICAPIVYAVTPDTPLNTVVKEMAKENYGSTVVIDDDEKVVGIFTAVDACQAFARSLA